MLCHRSLPFAGLVAIGLAGMASAAEDPGRSKQASDPEAPVAIPAVVGTFFESHCNGCHGSADDEPAGEVSLAGLATVDRKTLVTWQRALDKVASGEMPPDDEPRPPLAEREAVIAAISAALRRAGVDVPREGGPLPGDGNRIEHDRLFSGVHRGPASSPPRFWRRSQPQYDALMEQLWVIPKLRYEKAHTRTDPQWAGYGYAQPFPALDPERFTDYSGEVHADEAVLRALLEAGGQIAERLTSDETAYAKSLQPPVAVGVPSIRRGSEWERFKVSPPERPAEFAPFLAEMSSEPTPPQRAAAVERVFRLILNRPPTTDEAGRYGGLLERSTKKNGPLAALRGLITAVVVSPEFVFRMEVGLGKPDEHGRRMLSPNELVHAIAYALTDDGPDRALRDAAREGRLRTRADVEREVRRLLGDESIEKQRRLRFFQEFFGYHRAVDVFKDRSGWKHEAQYLVRDADLLVEHVLAEDRDVLARLLTADRYFVAYPNIKDPELFDAIIAKTIAEAESSIARTKQRGREIGPSKDGRYSRAWAHVNGRALIPRTVHNDRGSAEMSYIRVYGIDGNTFEWTRDQPIAVPGRRAGLLTHPAWLVAHSGNFDNDVVRRGKWIREHLLADTVPDVPIDVAAMVPDEPEHTLRHRMRVTREARCIRCHRLMDPLGLPFEIYDHYGQFREREMVGTRKSRGVEIDASGAILFSGESALDAPVEDAIDLVKRLSKSQRVRQSFVRHAFRFWMGRNERLSDSPTLMAADRAYAEHAGSFDELLVSLLTSDSFLYRK